MTLLRAVPAGGPGPGRLGGRPHSLGPRITFTLHDNGGKPGLLPSGGCPVMVAAQEEEGRAWTLDEGLPETSAQSKGLSLPFKMSHLGCKRRVWVSPVTRELLRSWRV